MPLLETLAELLEFANAARKLVSRPDGEIDHSLGDRLSTVLRTLYFPRSGILGYLLEIERGEAIDPNRTQKALIAFNDRQWQISGALAALEFDQLAKELKLNIATIDALDRVRDEKSGLRQEIQNEINYYGQRGVKADRQRVSQLITAIRSLNESIKEADRAVNSRARAH
jgi:hypothetical protein